MQKIQYTSEDRARRRRIELDAIDGGFHETLMRDPVTGRIVRRPALAEGPAQEVPSDPAPAEEPEKKEETETKEEKTADESPAEQKAEEKPADTRTEADEGKEENA